MTDLSDFERGQIIGARVIAGASIQKISAMFNVSKNTILEVLTIYDNEGENFRRKPKLSDGKKKPLKQAKKNPKEMDDEDEAEEKELKEGSQKAAKGDPKLSGGVKKSRKK